MHYEFAPDYRHSVKPENLETMKQTRLHPIPVVDGNRLVSVEILDELLKVSNRENGSCSWPAVSAVGCGR